MAWLSSSNNDRVTLKLGRVTAVKQRLLAEIKRERRPIHELFCSRYSLRSVLIPHTYQSSQTKGPSQSRFSHLRSSQYPVSHGSEHANRPTSAGQPASGSKYLSVSQTYHSESTLKTVHSVHLGTMNMRLTLILYDLVRSP